MGILEVHTPHPKVKMMRFWSDLSMWNKFGLCFVAALAIVIVIMWLV